MPHHQISSSRSAARRGDFGAENDQITADGFYVAFGGFWRRHSQWFADDPAVVGELDVDEYLMHDVADACVAASVHDVVWIIASRR